MLTPQSAKPPCSEATEKSKAVPQARKGSPAFQSTPPPAPLNRYPKCHVFFSKSMATDEISSNDEPGWNQFSKSVPPIDFSLNLCLPGTLASWTLIPTVAVVRGSHLLPLFLSSIETAFHGSCESVLDGGYGEG